jgi:dienelactone hydrolase
MKLVSALLILCLLMACAPQVTAPTLTPRPTRIPSTRTPAPSVTPYPTPTRAPTWTPEPTPTAQISISTSDPFNAYTMYMLRMRQYGGGEAENLATMAKADSFIRYSIRYPSDGLKVYGFMSVPFGKGPFPVIIVLHGYINPAEYKTIDYTTEAADGLTKQGYIVIHPNLRNFPPSDRGDALFRVGYAIDVLNLIALVQQKTGQPGLFEKVDAGRMGIWSHSMGGEIALRVAVVSHDIKAIVLYSPMSGDEQKNSQFFNDMTGSSENKQELLASPQSFAAISPATYYKDINAAIQIHHGTADTVIPVAWAEETCQALKDAGRQVECYYYAGAEHSFRTRYLEQFGPRVDGFFAKYLKP